ncbi:hypothetical protein [Arachnia propionica]|jgi:hypothetical protein|uniref:hypothetical protein n=1 Tax=Arachnia propionica TaxID=1750 RepID=UPI00242BC70F|nr:hypothetical protein [Arachnia propionica]
MQPKDAEAKTRLRQEDMIQRAFLNGTEQWTTVYDDWNFENGITGGWYCAFSRPEQRDAVLSKDGWNLTKGGGMPGFYEIFDQHEVAGEYSRCIADPGIEPLVLVQEFHGVVPDSLHISEEFYLLMNLWRNPRDNNYYEIGDDGSKELGIQFKDGKIVIRTSLLRRYQAARQLDLLLFSDSIVWVDSDLPKEAFVDDQLELVDRDKLFTISRAVGKHSIYPERASSRLLTKKLLPPRPQETCGIFPWDRVVKYMAFIIGEDDEGQPIEFTCNPDELANYFGKNPDAPHYLTPVFFKPEVMQRYYDDPTIYSVSDGRLSCAMKWGVQIDNGSPEFVAVFLGDIGRDIPPSHWKHWASYNIVPPGRMSDSAVHRSFYGRFIETENPEFLFKYAYEELQDAWERNWGWKLYRDPAGNDREIIHRFRIPLTDRNADLNDQLLNLAKLTVDLLNERDIGKHVIAAESDRGIAKLKRFLEEQEYKFTDRDIVLLKRIQRLRSMVVAHTSGSKGAALLENELAGRSEREFFIALLQETTTTMKDLADLAPRDRKRVVS